MKFLHSLVTTFLLLSATTAFVSANDGAPDAPIAQNSNTGVQTTVDSHLSNAVETVTDVDVSADLSQILEERDPKTAVKSGHGGAGEAPNARQEKAQRRKMLHAAKIAKLVEEERLGKLHFSSHEARDEM